MDKLTHLEATKILTEAYRLRTKFRSSGSRLGQSIHWVCNDELSYLKPELQEKLLILLDHYHAGESDFYHWVDDDKILTVFYSRYVQENNYVTTTV